MADIVIGSGPSGLAVALARLARGSEVIVLDGGKSLDEPAVGDVPARAEWMAPQFETRTGQVRRYGSDFGMEPPEETFAGGDAIGLRSSRAVGGLSNLWGAAVLPWRQVDVEGWPVPFDAFVPSWRALAEHVPLAAAHDDLSALFPNGVGTGSEAIAPGPQIAELLRRLGVNADRLGRLSTVAGVARVAVAPGCRQCGLCLHGCPWGLIWSARRTLAGLVRDGRIAHRPGAIVRALSEDAEGATAHLADGTAVHGDRVFVAAGVLETARLLMASEHGPPALTLRESQFAFLPMLHRWRAARRPDREPLNTLPQAFVEIADAALSPHSFHAQLYGWNEFYARDLRANYGRRLPFAGPLLDALARRLIVAQLFLHSNDCGSIALRLAPDGRLAPEVQRNPGTATVLAGAIGRLAASMRLGGLQPLRFAARLSEPGASFHVGASLPMRTQPGARESDTLGRPAGARRIHVVDASVLPAVPATTITWGVMGNAHRIGLAA